MDQTQIKEEDPQFRDFMNRHSVSRLVGSQGLIEQAGRAFLVHSAERALIFCNLKYNKFTNLPNTQEYRMALYGMCGMHQFSGRATRYTNFYFSDAEDMQGADFFANVFDSAYLSEKEAHADQVSEVLERKIAAADENKKHTILEISEDDQELACRIAERLWTTQLETKGIGRLVICLNERENLEERSEELLRQIYMLLPPKLRLNMGFATCATFDDIRALTEDLDLPIHVFTMYTDDITAAKAQLEAANLKYPVTLFDVENMWTEPCDMDRMELVFTLSGQISSMTEARMAYGEKMAMKENGNRISFRNMEATLRTACQKNLFWWERDDIESLQEVYRLYKDQSELMEMKALQDSAAETFSGKMITEKDYVSQLAEIVMDESIPERQEMLELFSDKLQMGKLIDAMELIKSQANDGKDDNQRQMAAALQAQYSQRMEESSVRLQQALQEQEQVFRRQLEDQQEEFENRLREQETDILQQQSEREQALQKENEQLQTELKNMRERMESYALDQERAAAYMEEQEKEIERLKSAGKSVQTLKVNDDEYAGKLRLQKNALEKLKASNKKKGNIALIASATAVICLIAAIVMLILFLGAQKQINELKGSSTSSDGHTAVLESTEITAETEETAEPTDNSVQEDST